MAKIIGLPKLSPTMEEGTLVRWVKQEGDTVEVDDLVAEVETDKATMEFRSFDKGVLLKHLAPEGAVLAPDQPVMIFGRAGDDIEALLKQVGGDAPAAPVAKPAAKSSESSDDAPAEAAEQPAGKAPETEEEEADGTPSSSSERQVTRDESVKGRVLASPVVRKIAREKNIDLTGVQGSGPGGRVIKRDVEGGEPRVGLPGLPVRGPSAPPPAHKPAAAAPAASPAPAAAASTPTATGEGRVEKLSSMRKTIARRLTESKQQVPHFYLTIDVDAEALVALRAMFNEQLARSGEKVSLNDFVIKAAASALRRLPKVNVSFAGDSAIYHDRVHISVAVAIPDGLVTPVVRDADRLGVLAISQAVRDLAGRAKAKKLKPEEMQGGTFSISNLGMYGVDEFAAVINPPEGAIIAVGAVRDVPVVKEGAVVPGKRMGLTMSCDHRVIDGALGAEWLRLLREMLESPVSMLL